MLLDPPVPVIPRNWYCQNLPGAEISLAERELPVEPPGDLVGECCRYRDGGREAQIAPCEVRAEVSTPG